MVSGGQGEKGVGSSVELLYMNGTWICPMPPMPERRYGHTQTGPVVCGGWPNAGKTCITFFSGGEDWVKTHKLAKERYTHNVWASSRGVMLMGGFGRHWREEERTIGTSTEILSENGDTAPGFNLDYETW